MIEVREVDARAEHAAPLVFGMIDRAAAHHGDLRLWIKQCEIDTHLQPVEGGLIFRVEKARVALGHDCRFA